MKFKLHDHTCLIYESKKEQFAAVAPFIKEGLENDERCFYMADDNSTDTVLNSLAEKEIDVYSALKSGYLTIITAKESYLRGGFFDPDRMIEFLRTIIPGEGKRIRVTGEMTWFCSCDDIASDDLIYYESKLNSVFPDNKVTALCQYNKSVFSSSFLINVLETHPLVIYNETLCNNCYYVPEEELFNDNAASAKFDRMLKSLVDKELREAEILDAFDAFANSYKARILNRLSNNTGINNNGEGFEYRNLLTTREREILSLIAGGLLNREIAYRLKISIHTVNAHRSKIMKKLNVHSTANLVKYALNAGIAYN